MLQGCNQRLRYPWSSLRHGRSRVSRGKDGRILVHLDAEETLGWEHVQEHLSSDQLLDILAGWKVAMAEDVEARSSLFQLLMEKAESETGLPVEKGLADVDNKHPYLHAYLVAALYDQITSTAVGRPRTPLGREQFVEEPGRVYLRGFLVIEEAAGEQVQKAIRFLLEAQRSYGNSDHAKAMSAAYEVANARAAELKRSTRRIELAVEVPGKCQQCGPMSGAPAPFVTSANSVQALSLSKDRPQ